MLYAVIVDNSRDIKTISFEKKAKAIKAWNDSVMEVIGKFWPKDVNAAPCSKNLDGSINYAKGQTFYFHNSYDTINVRIEEVVI